MVAIMMPPPSMGLANPDAYVAPPGRYVKVHQDVLDRLTGGLDFDARAVLLDLGMRANYRSHAVSVGTVTAYADILGIPRRRLRGVLDRLEDAELIRVENVKAGSTNVYVVVVVYAELIGGVRVASSRNLQVVEPARAPARAPAREVPDELARQRAKSEPARASARELPGETPPTTKRSTTTPTTRGVEDVLAFMRRSLGEGFAPTGRLRRALSACLDRGWDARMLAETVMSEPLGSARDVGAVLTYRAETVGSPPRDPADLAREEAQHYGRTLGLTDLDDDLITYTLEDRYADDPDLLDLARIACGRFDMLDLVAAEATT